MTFCVLMHFLSLLSRSSAVSQRSVTQHLFIRRLFLYDLTQPFFHVAPSILEPIVGILGYFGKTWSKLKRTTRKRPSKAPQQAQKNQPDPRLKFPDDLAKVSIFNLLWSELPLFQKKTQKCTKKNCEALSFAPQACPRGNSGTSKTLVSNKMDIAVCLQQRLCLEPYCARTKRGITCPS